MEESTRTFRVGQRVWWNGSDAVIRAHKLHGYLIDTKNHHNIFAYESELTEGSDICPKCGSGVLLGGEHIANYEPCRGL